MRTYLSNRLAICPKRRQLGCGTTAQSHCRLCKPHRRASFDHLVGTREASAALRGRAPSAVKLDGASGGALYDPVAQRVPRGRSAERESYFRFIRFPFASMQKCDWVARSKQYWPSIRIGHAYQGEVYV